MVISEEDGLCPEMNQPLEGALGAPRLKSSSHADAILETEVTSGHLTLRARKTMSLSSVESFSLVILEYVIIHLKLCKAYIFFFH